MPSVLVVAAVRGIASITLSSTDADAKAGMRRRRRRKKDGGKFMVEVKVWIFAKTREWQRVTTSVRTFKIILGFTDASLDKFRNETLSSQIRKNAN